MGTPFTTFPITTKDKSDLGAAIDPPAGSCGIGYRDTGGSVFEFFAFSFDNLGGTSEEVIRAVSYQIGGTGAVLSGYLVSTDGGATTYIANAGALDTPIATAVERLEGWKTEQITFVNGESDLTFGTPVGEVILYDTIGRVVLGTNRGFTLSGANGDHVTLDGNAGPTQVIPDGTYTVGYYVVAPIGGVTFTLREPDTFAADGAIDSDTVNIAEITGGTSFTIGGTRRSLRIVNRTSNIITVDTVSINGKTSTQLYNAGGGWTKDVDL